MPKPRRKQTRVQRRKPSKRSERRSRALAVANRPSWDLTTEEQLLVKNMMCPGATDKEFEFCMMDAKHRRLDPVKKQIWFIPRWSSDAQNEDGTFGRKTWVPQVSIDGLRHIAARDHRDYGSEDEPEFGPMKKVDYGRNSKGQVLSIMAPEWARVSVWKKGADRPTTATVWWDEIYPDISRAPMVRQMPRLMLGKCGSAQANRKAYPETGGLYIPEEFYGQPADFTPGGRHLLREDNRVATTTRAIEAEVERQKAGSVPSPQKAIPASQAHAPAGKPPTTKAPAPAQQAKAPSQQPSKEYVGVVTLDWTQDESSPVLRGDIDNLIPFFEKHCHMTRKDDWWHVQARDSEAIKQMCEELGPYQFVEILPKADSSSGGFPAQASGRAAQPLPPEKPAAQGRGARPQSAGAPAAELLLCKIERSIAGMCDKTPVRDVTVLTPDKKKPTYRCFHKSFFESFDKGVGQEALLVLKRNNKYTNIERPIRIGSKTWDDNGVAEIQKDREAGQRTLY